MGVDWSNDSNSLLVGGFVARGSWGTRTARINVNLSGKIRRLLDSTNPAIMGATPSSDGRRLAIGANSESANVWLLEDF